VKSESETLKGMIAQSLAESTCLSDIPEVGDYVLQPSGPLGCLTEVGVIQEGLVGVFNSTLSALEFVRERMEKEQFYPSVWWCSDHGNFWLIDDNGSEIRGR